MSLAQEALDLVNTSGFTAAAPILDKTFSASGGDITDGVCTILHHFPDRSALAYDVVYGTGQWSNLRTADNLFQTPSVICYRLCCRRIQHLRY